MSGKGSKTGMTKADAGRFQSSQVETSLTCSANTSLTCWQTMSGGDMGSGGFASRAQAAGDKNANAAGGQTGAGGAGGKGGSGDKK